MTHQDLPKMYLNPFTDFGFKKLFANPKHLGPLRDFITQALLPFGIGEIGEIELLDRDLLPDGPEIRRGTVDVLCRIPQRPFASKNEVKKGGEQIIVEMQLCEQKDFLKRATFYASGVYRNQLKKGELYDKLRSVYLIALLDFKIFDDKEPVSWHTTCNIVTKNPSIGNIFMTMVELPKFTKSIEQVSSQLDEWIYLMKHIREWDDFPPGFTRPPLKEAAEILWEGALSREEQRIYEQIELAWQTEVLAKRDQEQKLVEAREDGMTRGLEKGIAEGMEKGKALASKAARELLDRGLSRQDVAKVLGIDPDELEQML